MKLLAQIETPPGRRTFTAGLVLVDDVVTEAAPIVRSLLGRSRSFVRDYAARHGWSVTVVTLDGKLVAKRPGEPARQRIATAAGRHGKAYLDEDRDDEALAMRLSIRPDG